MVLAFNRGRMMVLPQAASKATGLREALTILRLSAHNAMAIGDPGNDHELLRVCEAGVAVCWGSAALKIVADYVLAGDGPPAVAAYIRALGKPGFLPAGSKSRRNPLLGHAGGSAALARGGRQECSGRWRLGKVPEIIKDLAREIRSRYERAGDGGSLGDLQAEKAAGG